MDTEDDFNEEGFSRARKNKEKPPLWDSFQDPPSKKATGSAASWTKLGLFLKLFKLFTYIFVFAIILVSAALSKLSFVFMVAQVEPNRRVKYCYEAHHGEYVADLPLTEHVLWIWALIISFAAPEIFTFFRSLRICIFKDVKSPTWPEVLLVISFELLHVIGLAILTFYVFVQLDSLKALMLCNAVSFTPALLNVLIGTRNHWKSIAIYSISILALMAQASAFVVWPSLINSIHMQILVIPLILVSLRWWENYINSYSSIGNLIKMVRRTKSRYHTYLYLSPLKVIVFACIAFSVYGVPIAQYFSMFTNAWNSHFIAVKRVDAVHPLTNSSSTTATASSSSKTNETFPIKSDAHFALHVLLLQVVSSYLCYIFAKFACKIKIQEFSYALPLSLSTPLAVAATFALTWLSEADVCSLSEYLPKYLALRAVPAYAAGATVNIEGGDGMSDGFVDSINKFVGEHLWIWLLWWISHLWVTHHVWCPKNDKNLPTEKLFICPWYCGFLVEQCITLNRRIVDWNEEYLSIKVSPFICWSANAYAWSWPF
uniref:Chitin synthase chs-1/2 N-terminal putative transporter domain-containing protein n=1 Tax=Stomoxys calcitrans TaxID=35570 RepID=A0A1I8PZ90_STOCA